MCRLFFFFLILSNSYSAFSQCFETVTFSDPGMFQFDVPNVSANYIIEIEVRGADGGDFIWGTNPQSNGGEGAIMKASYLLPQSSELLILVGESGYDGAGDSEAGGGGGATGVIIDNSEVLLVAAGGGGAGQFSIGRGALANPITMPGGGDGSEGAGGGGFDAAGSNGNGSTGGGAGSLFGLANGGSGSAGAGAGGAGFAGGGGGSDISGGGGGGYQGGDGGDNSDLPGDGGDSFVSSDYSGFTIANIPGQNGEGNNVDGYVTITCVPFTSVMLDLVSTNHPLCHDDLEGQIVVDATDGLPPYEFSLNGGLFSDSNIFSGLAAGSYVVTVRDGLGNTDQVNVTLDNPEELQIELVDVVDNICFGATEGMIQVNGTGGTSDGNYLYTINSGLAQSDGLFSNLGNGFYVVEVIDDNMCIAQVTATINSGPEILMTLVENIGVSCPGDSDGSANVFAAGGNGGYQYAIDSSAFDVFSSFDNLAPGVHIYYVKDNLGCTESLLFNTAEPEPLSLTANILPISCQGDSTAQISIVVEGGNAPYTFSFDGQESDSLGVYSGLPAGQYTVQVSDSNGCFIDDVVEVNEGIIIDIQVLDIISASCMADGSVSFNVSGGQGELSVLLGDSLILDSLLILPADTYTLMVNDTLGCSSEVNFTIDKITDIEVTVLDVASVSCAGESDGSALISATGGQGSLSYSFDGEIAQENGLFDSLSAGNYTLITIDSIGCSVSTLVNVPEPDSLIITLDELSNVTCYGGADASAIITFQGGIQPYDVSASAGVAVADSFMMTIDSLAAGEVFITLSDSLNCISTDTFLIGQNDPIQLSVDSVSAVNCAEAIPGFLSISAIGGLGNINFDNGIDVTNGVFDSLQQADYTIVATDSLGCTASDSIEIRNIGSLIVNGTGTSGVSCNGESDGLFVVNISNSIGDITWRINGAINPDSNFVDLPKGQYTVVAEDSYQCTTTIDFEIEEPAILSAEIEPLSKDDDGFLVVVQGGVMPYLYSIDDGVTFQEESLFSGLSAGDYIVLVSDGNGCEVEIPVTIITNSIDLLEDQINVWPNPTNGMLYMTTDNGYKQTAEMQIIDISGEIVLNGGLGDKELDVSSLKAGVYYIRIQVGGNSTVKKIVKI